MSNLEQYILAIDEGTTSCRTLLINKSGEIIGQSSLSFTQHLPKTDWVEHEATEIWNNQKTTMINVLNDKSISVDQIAAIGITNQRETVVVWNPHTGLPLYNAIVWQDQRTADYCQKLIKNGYEAMIHKKTGLKIVPYFSATKLKYILDKVDPTRELCKKGEIMAGTMDSWLIFKLTGNRLHITDVTNASRTLLFNIHTLKWDQELLKLFNIPENILPIVKSSSEKYGTMAGNLLKDDSHKEIPITSAIGDQQASLFGHLCLQPGEVKNTYGTGSFIIMNTGDKPIKSKNGLLTTIAFQVNGKVSYALEGSVFISGAAIQWLRDEMRLLYNSAESEWYANLVNKNDDQRIYVVPAFTGLGAPYWNSYSRGAIFGIERATKREHIIKATLESLAYQSYDVIKAMAEDLREPIKSIKVDGGASNNDYLMQFQSDIAQREIVRPSNIEVTALGAAYLAGLAVGFWNSISELQKIVKDCKSWMPCISSDEQKKLYKGWTSAVSRTINWVEDLKI